MLARSAVVALCLSWTALADAPASAPDESDVQSAALDRPTGKSQTPRTLEDIKKSGTLRILTRNNSTSFFIYRGHRMGFDYELGKRLAQKLGVRAQFVVPRSWGELIPALLRGEGDVVAGEMTVTPERQKQVLFAAPYLSTSERIITKKAKPPLASPEALSGTTVRVRKSSSYWQSLLALNAKLTAAGKAPVTLEAAPEDQETDDLIDDVAHGKVGATVADELIARQVVALVPGLEIGPALGEPKDLAWAVHPDVKELVPVIDALFAEEKKGPEFNVLKHKYFEVERASLERGKAALAGDGSLSPYDPLIKKAAAQYGYDWRLVAAQIYQESRFDPHNKSWCGAQGLFQIMPTTAKELGVVDPFDPKQGIEGGAKYMGRIMKHFADVPDPVERYKLSLAGYNCGPGHVDDARDILTARKLPKDTWKDVMPVMLELAKEKVHGHTAHGFCRCGEPVDYVNHILERYDGYRQLIPDAAVKDAGTGK